ncbi:hypothetical protein DFH06DRAFT_1226666 [Mycena polygramma]|nr:hypothetical protein DFH06DRAFT_1226666 [Mycena polygramma]
MPALTRTESIHSWWSDSNSIGATISIHAAAKPLMKLMYHEQVRSFIKRNPDIPLSATTMELCFSYLAFKYISHATKSLLVKELSMRVIFKEEARVVVESVIPRRDLITELLGSPDTRVRQHLCKILETLATHDSKWGLEILPSCIGTLISDEKPEIRAHKRLLEVVMPPDLGMALTS